MTPNLNQPEVVAKSESSGSIQGNQLRRKGLKTQAPTPIMLLLGQFT